MDIRKFFGSAGSVSNKAQNGQKDAKKIPAKTEKNSNSKVVGKSITPKRPSSSPSKKPQVTKKFQDEESVIIDDCSDEDVIKSSLEPKKNGEQSSAKENGQGSSDKKNGGSNSSQRNKTEKVKNKRDPSKEKPSVNGKGRKENNLDSEEVIEVDNSQPDESTKDTKSKPKKSSSQSEGLQSSKKSGKDKGEKSEEKAPLRSSPRKQNSTSGVEAKDKERKSKKRALSDEKEDDELDNKKSKPKKLYSFCSSEESDTEEVISVKRARNGKRKGKTNKKANRALDSDSDEDPLAETEDKPKAKRKKKKDTSNLVIPDSDEEKEPILTAMDKFVIHKAKTPQAETKKKEDKKEEKAKVTPISVADFFGDGSASRSARKTAVAKRKLDDDETPQPEPKREETSIDLTFDEEMHDDEDFMATLEQLDGPDVKKVKRSTEEQDTADVKASPAKGSIASKLADKMKGKNSAETNGKSNRTASPKKSPAKLETSGKGSSKKGGKVYTMEMDRVRPPTVVVSPGSHNKKPEKEATPVKPVPKQADKSAEKPKDDTEEDDGFGGPKGIKGFQAFKQRGGPLALGSKEIPEGEENCLEGLTFVITGVLDSIERDDAKSLVEKHGGKVTGNVSGRTSYVVVGRDPGESKIKKATQLKVKEIDEDGLFELVRTRPGKVSKYEIQAREQIKKEASLKAEKEKEEEKRAQASKKLASFRSDKDDKNTPTTASSSSPKKKEPASPFTQIKDSNAVTNSSSAKAIATPSPATATKLLCQSQSPSQKALNAECKTKPSEMNTQGDAQTLLWVDKHKPTSLKQIIGQQGEKSNARKLMTWLKAWHHNIIVKGLKTPAGNFFNKGGDGAGCRAALLSGPPGIGKTTSATLVCQELGFSYVELNASDTRSKRSLKEVVAESLNNNTLMDYTGVAGEQKSAGGKPMGQSHCLIMDEVDGMAGNEDRGGLQELVQLIKKSKIPIICICNDRNSMKMRTLSNYCLDLRFQRPRVEQIKGAMMSLAFKEGLKIPPAALNEIILASNNDIRQVIHNLSVWSASDKTMTFEQVKRDSQKAQKDLKLGPFDVVRKVFVNDDETRKMTMNDKSDLFFNDYSFGPLFVHENYTKVIPNSAGGKHSKHLSCLARTIDSICDGDLVDKLIRRDGNWNLLPTQAMFASVIPGEVMRGSFPAMADFPAWLGKFSSTNKTHRILQELSTHMALEVSCDKRGLNLDYLPSFRACLTQPLLSHGSEGVSEVIKVMDEYDIIKEDFDNILDISKWPGSFDPMSKLDSKTKAAFTRQYNKQIHMTPYATGAVGGKKKRRGAPMEEDGMMEEGGEEGGGAPPPSDDEEEEGLEANSMIKTKKPTASKGKGNTGNTAGKGKGKGAKK